VEYVADVCDYFLAYIVGDLDLAITKLDCGWGSVY
jgi:hypothetical protein